MMRYRARPAKAAKLNGAELEQAEGGGLRRPRVKFTDADVVVLEEFVEHYVVYGRAFSRDRSLKPATLKQHKDEAGALLVARVMPVWRRCGGTGTPAYRYTRHGATSDYRGGLIALLRELLRQFGVRGVGDAELARLIQKVRKGTAPVHTTATSGSCTS